MLVDLWTLPDLPSFFGLPPRQDSSPASFTLSSELIRRPLINLISFVAGGGLNGWVGGFGASLFFLGRSPDLADGELFGGTDEEARLLVGLPGFLPADVSELLFELGP
jgi:hypothetical protein